MTEYPEDQEELLEAFFKMARHVKKRMGYDRESFFYVADERNDSILIYGRSHPFVDEFRGAIDRENYANRKEQFRTSSSGNSP